MAMKRLFLYSILAMSALATSVASAQAAKTTYTTNTSATSYTSLAGAKPKVIFGIDMTSGPVLTVTGGAGPVKRRI